MKTFAMFAKKVLFAGLALAFLLGAPAHAQAEENSLNLQPRLFFPSVAVSEAPMVPRSAAGGPVDIDRVDTVVRGGMQDNAQAQCVNKVYTPVADADGKLRMTGMSIVGNDLASLPEAGSEFIAGAVNDIAITRLNGCNFMVTAVRTQNNALKLISWFSSADGFERLHDTGNNGMGVKQVAVTNTNDPFFTDPGAGRVVTAVRSNLDQLVVRLWYLGPDSSFSFNPINTKVDETITQVEIVSIAPPPGMSHIYSSRVVTAVRTTSGRLRLISWGISVGGGLYRLADSGNLAGNVQDIALARYDTHRVVTAVKNSDGNLQLVAWKLETEDEIVRLYGEEDPTFNDPFAGQVGEIAITPFDFNGYAGFDYVATAVRTAGGNLRLIAWGIDSWGNIKRHGDSGNQADAASRIQIGWSQESNRLVTSARDGDGNLRVIAWRTY